MDSGSLISTIVSIKSAVNTGDNPAFIEALLLEAWESVLKMQSAAAESEKEIRELSL
jgi:hypothetical protein